MASLINLLPILWALMFLAISALSTVKALCLSKATSFLLITVKITGYILLTLKELMLFNIYDLWVDKRHNSILPWYLGVHWVVMLDEFLMSKYVSWHEGPHFVQNLFLDCSLLPFPSRYWVGIFMLDFNVTFYRGFPGFKDEDLVWIRPDIIYNYKSLISFGNLL